MPVVAFLGRVLPESIPFSFSFRDPIRQNPYGIPLTLHVTIDQSKIRIDCELPEYRKEYLVFLHKCAYDLTRAQVDLVSFAEGLGWVVFLETFVDPDGHHVPLFIHARNLAAECNTYKMNFKAPEESPDFMEAAKAVIAEPALLHALNDLTETLTRPYIALVNCARVLDRLRKLIAPEFEKNRKRGFEKLQTIVNVDARFTEWVSELSAEPRHGGWQAASDAEVREAVTRCWLVMNRFIEYRKRGNQPLPLDRFPMRRG